MGMTSREVVVRTVGFRKPDRLALALPEKWGNDFGAVSMEPSTDARPKNGPDEWGTVWANIGVSNLGQVKEPVLKDWADLDRMKVPDIKDPARWKTLDGARERAGDLFLMAYGVSLYERVHFLRGLENAWTDIYVQPRELGRLIDLLVDMNLYAIERFAKAGADGYMFCDDWGLQNRMMISPDAWRELWKPRYAKVYGAAHDAGLLTFLHSCGCITDILDDLIEAGLDVIQFDQQENMGLELLGTRFGGRIAFFCPVDIQNTMVRGTTDEIRAYCRKMVALLGRPTGGFIAKWYTDPVGAGHRDGAVEAMCDEFVKISAQMAAR